MALVVVAFLLGGGGAQPPVLTTVAADTATPAHADTPTPFGTPAPIPTATSLPDVPPPNASLGDTWTRPTDEAVMVYVPAGEFEMGSTEGDSDEQPVHDVTLDGFWIDKHEVTNAQFAAFLNEEGNQEEGGVTWLDVEDENCLVEKSGEEFQPKSGYADHPVVKVSWYGARAYAEWVGGRLPTEAEWEYAARGPEGRIYPWGDDEPTCDLAQYRGCSGDTVPVDSLPNGASWCGALNMAGNVWEWVADWYDGDYYARSPSENPGGPEYGSVRVVRGGSFYHPGNLVRCAFRNWYSPNHRLINYGFRVVVSPFSRTQ
jgi:formylglycine-generating enzyme required for sulfatase activity